MDELNLDLTPLAINDRILLSGLTVNQLLERVKHGADLEEAKQVVINAGLHIYEAAEDDVSEYLANADEFAEFKKAREAKVKETREFILENSKMTKDDIQDMTLNALEALAKSVAPKNKYIANGTRQEQDELVLLNEADLLKEMTEG
jgi:hypothetical protein